MADLRGQRPISVEAIERVEEGKGVPTILVLGDGRAVKLPHVGASGTRSRPEAGGRSGRARPSDTVLTAMFPRDGVELTHILVVGDLARARTFDRDVPEASIYRGYAGTSCVLSFQGT